MATRSEIYRARAVECEKIAADTIDPKISNMFGGLASQCRKFAAEIETREREEAAVRSPFVPIKQSGIFR
jgi:hypothetical protein